MKTLSTYLGLSLLPLLVLTSSCRSPARASAPPAADDAVRRLAQLQEKLYAAGQTNLAIEVSDLAGAFLVSEWTDEVKTYVGILRRLRSGNTNLIQLLEDDLDTALVSLTHFEPGPRQLKALEAAKGYRVKFPRKTENPELDAEVARALALPSGNER